MLQSTPQNPPSGQAKGEFDLNPDAIVERLDSWLDGAVRSLPNIGVAIVLLLATWGLAALAKSMIGKSLERRGRDNLGRMLGGFTKAVIIVLGALFAATIVLPTLNPGDLIAGLGVSSVAIGFAFKDILQNWLAGLLILLRQPFEVGDQIEVGDFEGTVDSIETRATIIRTYDGQKAVIPNSQIYSEAVLVKTAYEKRRSQYDVGIGYADDIDEACEIIKKTLGEIDGIEQDPAPQAFAWDLAASWVTLRVRWWTDTKRGDVVANRAHALRAIKKALDDARIDMPYETKVQLMHDQTESSDGDRDKQREGWPSPREGTTEPRWRAEQKRARGSDDDAESNADRNGARDNGSAAARS